MLLVIIVEDLLLMCTDIDISLFSNKNICLGYNIRLRNAKPTFTFEASHEIYKLFILHIDVTSFRRIANMSHCLKALEE